jgi:hypothetical protein
MNTCKQLIEIYRTANGCVYQCDQTSRFVLDFAGHSTSLNVLCFLSLKRRVDKIDIEELILSRDSDIEIINPCGSERIFALSLHQLIEFKELLSGTRVMLELNSIIRERLNSFPEVFIY